MRRLWLCTIFSLAACSGGDPPDICDEGPRYDPDVKAIVAARCIQCHSSNSVGVMRDGAPVGVDFDDFATLQPNIEAFAEALTSGVMPPRDSPTAPPATSAAERTQISEWRRCGFREE